MTAIDAVLQIIAEQKIMPAVINSRDPFNDLAMLDRVLGNNDVTDFDLCFAIDQDDFAIVKRRVHRFAFANVFMTRAEKD